MFDTSIEHVNCNFCDQIIIKVKTAYRDQDLGGNYIKRNTTYQGGMTVEIDVTEDSKYHGKKMEFVICDNCIKSKIRREV